MILTTGATGNIGREIVRQLPAGVKARAMVRNPAKAAEDLKSPNLELIEGDFAKPATLEPALRGIERAFLLSASERNVAEQEMNFFDAAKRAGVKHIVKLSVLGPDPNSPMLFMREHGKSEKALEQSGLAWTHLRPTFFVQNMLRTAGSIKSQNTFHGTWGDHKATHIDVRDIAAVAIKALTEAGHEGKAYALTGPQALSNAEIAAIMSKALGRAITYTDIPRAAYKKAMTDAGVPEWQAEAVCDLEKLVFSGQAAVVSDAVERVTKRKPIGFEQFVREHEAAFN